MPDTDIQSIGVRAMVNGKIYLDHRDLHIPHDTVPCQVQLMLIILGRPQQRILREGVAKLGARDNGCVILLRQFTGADDFGVIHLLNQFLILGVDLRLVPFVIVIGDHRVQRDPKCQDKDQCGTAYG